MYLLTSHCSIISDTMDNEEETLKERQENELQALNAIYCDQDIIQDLRSKDAPWVNSFSFIRVLILIYLL